MKTNEDNVQKEVALIDCLHVGDERLAHYLYQGGCFGKSIGGLLLYRVFEYNRESNV